MRKLNKDLSFDEQMKIIQEEVREEKEISTAFILIQRLSLKL
jgi:hypothetical protein